MRRSIVERLSHGPLPVGELAASLPIGRPAVSKHLRVLTDSGLITRTTRGTRNLYALAPDGLADLQQWLVDNWDSALSAYAAFVTERQTT
jgi:DNA-binding transcriptional ArsR family regulator